MAPQEPREQGLSTLTCSDHTVSTAPAGRMTGPGLRPWVTPCSRSPPATRPLALDQPQAPSVWNGAAIPAPGHGQGQSHGQQAPCEVWPAWGSCSFRCPAHSGCLNNWLCSWDETEAQVSTPGLKPFRVPRFTEEQVCRPWAASPHLRAAAAPGAPAGLCSQAAGLAGSRGLGTLFPGWMLGGLLP